MSKTHKNIATQVQRAAIALQNIFTNMKLKPSPATKKIMKDLSDDQRIKRWTPENKVELATFDAAVDAAVDAAENVPVAAKHKVDDRLKASIKQVIQTAKPVAKLTQSDHVKSKLNRLILLLGVLGSNYLKDVTDVKTLIQSTIPFRNFSMNSTDTDPAVGSSPFDYEPLTESDLHEHVTANASQTDPFKSYAEQFRAGKGGMRRIKSKRTRKTRHLKNIKISTLLYE